MCGRRALDRRRNRTVDSSRSAGGDRIWVVVAYLPSGHSNLVGFHLRRAGTSGLLSATDSPTGTGNARRTGRFTLDHRRGRGFCVFEDAVVGCATDLGLVSVRSSCLPWLVPVA